MAVYTIPFQSTTTPATGVPLWVINNGNTTMQFKINTCVIGPGPITPVDQSQDLEVVRTATAAPTGGSTTIYSLNPASVAAIAPGKYAANSALTVGTLTFTDILYRIGLHMRANFQWYANINREFYSLAGATTGGIGLDLVATSAAFQFEGQTVWEE